MKLMKKIINVLLITVMIFTELSPYAVFAAKPDTATKGQLYNPQTDSVGTSAIIQASLSTGDEDGEGDVEVQKIVSKTDVDGKYQVEFKVRGNKVTETTVTTKPVYAVVVLDRSNSMLEGNNKWGNAVKGAKDFAKELLKNVPSAEIALVTFYGGKNTYNATTDVCIETNRNGNCIKYSENDATLVRGFDDENANSNLDNVTIPGPTNGYNGGTNIEAGLKLAKAELDKINGDVFKYVVLIGDGSPTFYYASNGSTIGTGQGHDDDAEDAALRVATEIKRNAKIYAIGYEVPRNSDAEKTLKAIATPSSTVNGVTTNYYFNADANAVGGALTNIAGSITTESYAGTNATVEDGLGSGFTLTSGSATLTVPTITENWTSMGSFEITINGDLPTDWYPTNDGFTLTYTDAHNHIQTITSDVNPQVYWIQNEYKYEVEHYTENLNGGWTKVDTDLYEGRKYNDSVTYEINSYTGFTYDSSKDVNTNVTTQPSGDLVIKLYYVRNDYNYVVEHYLEDENGQYTKDDTKYRLEDTDDDNKIKYQDEAEYVPNSYTGYSFVEDKTSYNQDDLLVEDNDLVIKLYYDKNAYKYTINHYLEKKDGSGYELDATKEKNDKYEETATYTPNTYLGYEYIESKTNVNGKTNFTNSDLIIKDNSIVINLYYDLIDYTYTVEYYKQDLNSNTYSIVEKDTYTDSAYYNEEVSEEEKSYTGFVYEKTEYTNNDEVITSHKVVDNNLIIKVYYVREKYEYKVEHYLQDLGKNTYTKQDADTKEYNDVEYDSEAAYNKNNYDGFTYSETKYTKNNEVIDSNKVIDNDLVVKVYYNRSKYSYKVEHYLQDVGKNTFTLEDTTPYNNKEYGSEVIYTTNTYVGFTHDSTRDINTKVETVPANNDLVIKLYYVRGKYSYKVEHYLQNLDGKTYTKDLEVDTYTNVEFGSTARYEQRDYEGFVFNESKTEPTIRVVPANDGLVIKLYYDRAVCKYTVNYYYDNVKDNDKIYSENAAYGIQISTYKDGLKDGYHLVSHNVPITITNNETENVINVYYEKNIYTYKVEYYTEDLNADTFTMQDSYTRNEYHGETVTPDTKSYTGFTHSHDEYLNNGKVVESKVIVDNNLVIKVYFVRDNYSYKVKHYTEKLDGAFELKDTDNYDNKEYDSEVEYETNVYTGFTYSSELDVNTDVTNVPANNDLVIELYYVRDNYNYVVKHYTEKLDGTFELKDTDSYTDVEYDSEVVYEENVYTGFTYDSTKDVNTEVETVPANNDLVIELYYVRNTYKYVVEHYLENDDNEEFTLKVEDTETFEAKYNELGVYTSNEYDNYTFDDSLTEPEDLTVNDDTLTIKLYYLKNKTNVKVHYVIRDVDTLEYIPFDVYGTDGEGNNALDFAGLDLEDLILTGKVDTSFIINGRNPVEYEFVGLYEGNLLDGIEEVLISCNDDQSYEGIYANEELEFTYVYQSPAGDMPPITGIENSIPNYISYILMGIMTILVGGCYKLIKREEENELN